MQPTPESEPSVPFYQNFMVWVATVLTLVVLVNSVMIYLAVSGRDDVVPSYAGSQDR